MSESPVDAANYKGKYNVLELSCPNFVHLLITVDLNLCGVLRKKENFYKIK